MRHETTRAVGIIASLLLVPGLLVPGCGDQVGDAPSEPAGRSLAGRTYVVTGLDDPQHRIGPGATIRFGFSAHEVDAYAGCNHMSGLLTYSGDVLVVDSLGMTEMACDPPLMARDAWVSELLTSRPTYTVDGSDLTLVSGDTTVRLHEISAESLS